MRSSNAISIDAQIKSTSMKRTPPDVHLSHMRPLHEGCASSTREVGSLTRDKIPRQPRRRPVR
jgi:hypothetical protein